MRKDRLLKKTNCQFKNGNSIKVAIFSEFHLIIAFIKINMWHPHNVALEKQSLKEKKKIYA